MEGNSGNRDSIDLSGMNAAGVKEYILGFITTLKLTEKEILSLENEAAKWKGRADMARLRGADDLFAEAEKESEKLNAKLAALKEEELSLQAQIAAMRRQLPQQLLSLAARERSIDPDLLEQELLMALGQTEEEAATERAFRKLEKDGASGASSPIETALEALKAKLKGDAP